MNTTYTITALPGTGSGNLVNGLWTGLVGEILEDRADIIAYALSITSDRIPYLDYTTPFQDVGNTILVLAPGTTLDLLKFLSPFSVRLWVVIFFLTLVMAIVLWVSDRLSPYGYYHGRVKSEQERFNFSASLLLSMLVFVNRDREPSRSWGARTMLLIYYAFNVLIVSTYVANLAAAFTVTQASTTVQSLSDLKAPGVLFGVVISTSVLSYLQSLVLYNSHMVYYPTIAAAVDGLSSGNISAIVLDSPALDYVANQPPCNTFIVGGLFETKNYAIGLPYGNPEIKYLFSRAILQAREDGTIDSLYAKWWSVGGCTHSQLNSNQLDLPDVVGIFVMVGVFVIIGFLIVGIEIVFFQWFHKCGGKERYPCTRHIDKFFGYVTEEEDIQKTADGIAKDIIQNPLSPRFNMELKFSSRNNRVGDPDLRKSAMTEAIQ